jgi:ribulose-phosphate 3-epimerase
VRGVKRGVKIAPSILSADFSRLAEQVETIEKLVDFIHFDVMDGHFVPNISFGIPVLESLKKVVKVPFDVHLMVNEPEKFIDSFVASGSDILTVHIEATSHIHKVIDAIKQHGVKAGVAINPGTSLSLIEGILPYIDIALVMSVNPGFGGQNFIPGTIGRIRELRKMLENMNIGSKSIEVDGGVNP